VKRAARAAPLLLFALLPGCQTAPPTTPAAPVAADLLAPEPGATVLHIDTDASRIELRLAAAGPLAPLGHAHVVVAHQLAGELVLPASLASTRFELRFPVAAMSVDDAADRAAAGSEFSAAIPEAARSGTREHMLGAGQLDAAHFGEIVLRARSLRVLRGDAAAGEGEFDLTVQLLGRSVPLTAPVRWQHTPDGLRAQGELRLLQSALGIQPYSVGGGALRVADELGLRYAISAR
jgi:hypothetical protein